MPTSRRRVVTQQNSKPPVATCTSTVARSSCIAGVPSQSVDDREVARRLVEAFGPRRSRDDDVLEPQAEAPGHVDARLDAERVPGCERGAVATDDVRILVRLRTDAVTGAMHEVLAVAAVVDHVARDRVDCFA